MERKAVHVTYQDKELILVPTAHVSKDSAAFVRQVIEEENPDCICIELDEDRYASLKQQKKWEDTNIVDVIKQKKAGYLLVNLILSNYQKRMAKHLDSNSGQEMMEGIQAAEARNIPLVLADRPIQTTFMRIWRKQSFWDKCKLLAVIISSLFESEDEMSENDLLEMQQEDMLNAALQELREEFPQITEVLVHERDQYLAYKIKHAPGKKVVAILGAAHVIGMQDEWEKDYTLEPLLEIPPKGKLGKYILWMIPALLVLLVALTFHYNADTGIGQILSWIVWNGTLSAIGCVLCLAHPLTVLVAFLAAPVTSLSPLLAAGWFAGLTEATIRKPRVRDFERITDDMTSLKGLWKNKITKILLVVIFANVGSTLGTVISSLDIVQSFWRTVFGG